jgi:predicted chitinase
MSHVGTDAEKLMAELMNMEDEVNDIMKKLSEGTATGNDLRTLDSFVEKCNRASGAISSEISTYLTSLGTIRDAKADAKNPRLSKLNSMLKEIDVYLAKSTATPKVTREHLESLNWNNISDKMIDDLNLTLHQYGINTHEKATHFIAQASKETLRGYYETEFGGKSYFDKYEPGTKLGNDLGNTKTGDGYLFRGGGYIQTTGRWNYSQLAKHIAGEGTDEYNKIMSGGADYISKEYAWRGAGYFWQSKGLNDIVEKGGTSSEILNNVVKKVNPGELNNTGKMEERKEHFNNVQEVFLNGKRPIE